MRSTTTITRSATLSENNGKTNRKDPSPAKGIEKRPHLDRQEGQGSGPGRAHTLDITTTGVLSRNKVSKPHTGLPSLGSCAGKMSPLNIWL